MLSKLISRNQSMINMQARAFRASAASNKKPSIGDAVTILQSKVSGINQVVSIFPDKFKHTNLIDLITYLKKWLTNFNECRTTSRSSVPSSLLEMVLQESSVS
jgi:hypothetical protein